MFRGETPTSKRAGLPAPQCGCLRRLPARAGSERAADQRSGSARQHRILQDPDQDQHHERREVHRPGIGQDAADRAIDRLGQGVETAPERADEVVIGVDHIERDQGRQDRLCDDDPPCHGQQDLEDVEGEADYGIQLGSPEFLWCFYRKATSGGNRISYIIRLSDAPRCRRPAG